MYGITITGKNKATAKILSHLASYMFEQEFGEMKNFTKTDIEVLKKAKEVLASHLK